MHQPAAPRSGASSTVTPILSVSFSGPCDTVSMEVINSSGNQQLAQDSGDPLTNNLTDLSSLVWFVADLLRGDCKQSENIVTNELMGTVVNTYRIVTMIGELS